MISYEANVLLGSDYYMYTAGALAKKLFFYPVCTGYFKYGAGYFLRRDRYDSFLIILIKKGECTFTINGASFLATKDSVILLDCYAPHQYSVSKGCEALWLHFDGKLCRDYYEQIVQAAGFLIVPKNLHKIERGLQKIYQLFKNASPIREEQISRDICDILTELLFSYSPDTSAVGTQYSLADTVAYINEHFTETISLKKLAGMASLSPFYFTRIFTKETGMTPHQYIIAARINCAKFLLKTTGLSVKEVAFHSGFSDESSFCTTFKKWEQATPGDYRSL